jgi:hypothetical protein
MLPKLVLARAYSAGLSIPDPIERGYLYYNSNDSPNLEPFFATTTNWYAIKLNTIDVPRGWSLKGDFTVRVEAEGNTPELVVTMNLMIGLEKLTVNETFITYI